MELSAVQLNYKTGKKTKLRSTYFLTQRPECYPDMQIVLVFIWRASEISICLCLHHSTKQMESESLCSLVRRRRRGLEHQALFSASLSRPQTCFQTKMFPVQIKSPCGSVFLISQRGSGKMILQNLKLCNCCINKVMLWWLKQLFQ